MQANDVAFMEQFVQFHLADFGRKLEIGLGSVGAHLHAEANGDAGSGETGVSQAYNAEFFSRSSMSGVSQKQKSLLAVQRP